MNFSFKIFFLCKKQGSLTGIAQSAGHRNVHNFVMFLKQLIPHLHNIRRRWLRSCYRLSGSQFLVKFFRSNIASFIKGLFSDKDGHWKNMDVILAGISRHDSTVTVCHNCYLWHKILPWSVTPASIISGGNSLHIDRYFNKC